MTTKPKVQRLRSDSANAAPYGDVRTAMQRWSMIPALLPCLYYPWIQAPSSNLSSAEQRGVRRSAAQGRRSGGAAQGRWIIQARKERCIEGCGYYVRCFSAIVHGLLSAPYGAGRTKQPSQNCSLLKSIKKKLIFRIVIIHIKIIIILLNSKCLNF